MLKKSQITEYSDKVICIEDVVLQSWDFSKIEEKGYEHNIIQIHNSVLWD